MTRAHSNLDETSSLEEAPSAVVTVEDGREVAYTEYGAPDGTPLVVLHGTPGSRVVAWLFDEPARKHGVRILAPDRPGYGRSTPWPDRKLTESGEIVAAVLADAGVARAGIVGFSGGGPHALAVAATHGELVEAIDIVSGAPPQSLVSDLPLVQRLLGTLARRAPPLLKGLLGVQTRIVRRTPPAVVLSQYATASERAEIPPDVADCIRRDFLEAFARHRDGFVTETRLLADEWGFSPAAVDHTVRLWHGNADANAPLRGARRLSDELPNGELTVLENAGHLTALLRSRSRIVRSQRRAGAR
ncbi:alpha/beta fold hydrolase [Natrinema sp. H-ect4]|uniref:alpha/beta fold hydrolase n=1 Tax=Natrinema sp. H-ect4 TaxID=3242699 RepID=UPI0035A84E7F